MTGRRKRGSRNKHDRRRVAHINQDRLIRIVQSSELYDVSIRQTAVHHLVKISQRHRLRIPAQVRLLFCRKCYVIHRFGETTRVRIVAGQRIVTCLQCSTVRRFGGGPKFHRRNQGVDSEKKVTTSTRRNSEG